jgi:hypothetical protein
MIVDFIKDTLNSPLMYLGVVIPMIIFGAHFFIVRPILEGAKEQEEKRLKKQKTHTAL